ncbi:sensor histidine kinase [Sphaerisporangium album]|uniref:histidine kinase n=1 Tax=Sphaerisporangium album TaxID=509200 RepID=A0A367F8S8_9ACTN|nr:histidine kinase [Sphaerisporangium album]RCG26776.1 sensor histidine kinase [Sphaerisporangium album]
MSPSESVGEAVREHGAPRYRRLLPAAVADAWEPGDGRSGRRVRRTTRDWFVDVCVFLCAACFAVATAAAKGEPSYVPAWLLAADQLTGVLGCVALWLRRRWPVALAVVLCLLSTFSEFVGGAGLAALFTVAVHRPLRVVAPVGAVSMAASFAYAYLRPEPEMPFAFLVALGVTLNVAVIGWGMFVRAQRRLMLSLRERVERAETEAELRAEQSRLRAEQAQRLAREQIAREMHDMLGHRLSLLSVHAGALEFNAGASREQVTQAAGVIRDSAHQALQDLREVIGVLRAGDDAEAGPSDPDRPQPTLAGLPSLVEESRQAGMRVTLLSEVGDPDAAPAAAGRTAYRVAQEGLTNARKHAPGAEVLVRVSGGPGDGLTVELRNPLPARKRTGVPGAGPGGLSEREGPGVGGAGRGLVGPVEREGTEIPGAGRGLIGLAERATLAGGRLACGPLASGEFQVRAWLPWPA